MHLSQAIGYHSSVLLDGWDQTNEAWVSEVSQGDFRRQDQFLVNRSFGLVKRLFTTPTDKKVPVTYRCVRISSGNGCSDTSGGDVYILEAENPNIQRNKIYSYAYQFRRANYWAEIQAQTTVTSASGLEISTGMQTQYQCPADVERYGMLGSDEMEGLRYSQISVILPGNVSLNTENRIVIGTTVFEPLEIYTQVLEQIAICARLGDNV